MKTLLQILVLMAVISSGSNQLMAQWIQTNGPEGGHVLPTLLQVYTYKLISFGWAYGFKSKT